MILLGRRSLMSLTAVCSALLLAAGVLCGPLGPVAADPAPVALTGSVEAVQPSVKPGATAKLEVHLMAARPLPNLSLTLAVRDPKGRRIAPDQAVSTPLLPQGAAAYEFGVAMPSQEGTPPPSVEGIYSYEVVARTDGAEAWRDEGRLVVVDPALRPATTLTIVWQLDEGLHVRPDGTFTDTAIADSVSRVPGRRGAVASQAAQLAAHKGIRASVVAAPLTFSQIQRLSKGGRLVVGGTSVRIAPGSRSAGDARTALARWRRLARLARVQILAAPYAPAPLEELVRRGAMGDVRLQLQEGRAAIQAALSSSPAPVLTRARTTTEAVSVLARQGVTALVLPQDALPTLGRVPDKPLRLAADPRIRVLVADPTLTADATALADGSSPSLAGHAIEDLIVGLARRHLRGDSLAVVAVPPDTRPLDDASLGRLYSALERTPWVRTATVAQTLREVPAFTRATTLAPTNVRVGSNAFFRALAATRDDYLALQAMTETDNPIRLKALREFLVGETPDSRTTALIWQRAARALAKGEFSKVRLTANPSVTLTGQQGKIALSISNRAGDLVRAALLLSGEGVSFPDGRRRVLTIRPKETVQTVRVMLVGARTHSKVVARLVTGKRVLGRSVVAVRSTYIDQLSLVAAVILLLVGLLIYLWRRRGGTVGRVGRGSEERSR